VETRSPAPKQALEALQRELSARQSVLHFAHAAVTSILAVIGAGAAAKMVWDLTRDQVTEAGEAGRPWVVPVSILSAGLLVYAVVRYLMGRRALKRELASFAELQSLRRELKLEDPSQLLPR
jgi:hypothetical protein